MCAATAVISYLELLANEENFNQFTLSTFSFDQVCCAMLLYGFADVLWYRGLIFVRFYLIISYYQC